MVIKTKDALKLTSVPVVASEEKSGSVELKGAISDSRHLV